MSFVKKIFFKFLDFNFLTKFFSTIIFAFSIYIFSQLLFILYQIITTFLAEKKQIEQILETHEVLNKQLISHQIYSEITKSIYNNRYISGVHTILANYQTLVFSNFKHFREFQITVTVAAVLNIFFHLLFQYFNYFSLTATVVVLFLNEMLYKIILWLIFCLNQLFMGFYNTVFAESFEIYLEELEIEKKSLDALNPDEFLKTFILEEFNQKFIIHGSLSSSKIATIKTIKQLHKMKEYNIVFFIKQENLKKSLMYIMQYMNNREMIIVQNQEHFYSVMLNFMKNNKNTKEELILIIKNEIN